MIFDTHYLTKLLVDKNTRALKETLAESKTKVPDESISAILSSQQILYDNIVPTCQSLLLGPDVLQDLEIDQLDGKENVLANLVQPKTVGGTQVLNMLITNPTCDAQILNVRKKSLQTLRSKLRETNKNLEQQLDTLRQCESSLAWFYDPESGKLKNDPDQSIYKLVYFNNIISQIFNNSSYLLTAQNLYKIICCPLIGILTPVLYFIVPYLVLKIKLNVPITFVQYLKMMVGVLFASSSFIMGAASFTLVKYVSCGLSLLFYFQGLFNSIEIAKLSHKVSSIIYTNTRNFQNFLTIAQDLITQYWSDDITKGFIDSHCCEISPNVASLIQSWAQEISYDQTIRFSLLRNFGNELATYKMMNRDVFKPILRQIYVLDALISIVSNTLQKTNPFSFVKYLTSNTPMLRISNVVHPCLLHSTPNTIHIGKNHRISLITGPNAGGKSTLMKAIMTNIILAQSICISSCTTCSFTPFTFIHSQMNIPDCKGKESLFQAEMNRCKYAIDLIKTLKPRQYAFIGLDEVFNSTNPVEGIAGAYAILAKLGNSDNVAGIVTTHFTYLTKLARRHPLKAFSNFKMNVNTTVNKHCIDFPYILTPGISRQYIALDLLESSGFDKELVRDAQQIKNRLVTQRTQVVCSKSANSCVPTD